MNADSLSGFDSDPGSRADPSSDTISSFIADWVQIKYFYSEAARLAQELCETLLASNSIRAIVTYRVKKERRLEAKLRERVRKLGREYRDGWEIRDDIIDLAGVRISLYFPSDREKIDKIIHDAFTDVKHKSFPEQDDKRVSDSVSQVGETTLDFQQRFHGYSADHYCVRMRVENLVTKRLWNDFQKTNPVIEIQVASVLMHAWAEIAHDLVVKTPTSGPASQQELRLLDATNGLVHTGEVLIQQLQTAIDDRVAYQNKPFSQQYELLSFLRRHIKNEKCSMEHLDILLLVLKITNLDSPRKLSETLEGFIVPHKSGNIIALTLLEHILNTLGEEQCLENNIYLRARSVDFTDLEIDKKNSKCYATNIETRNKILIQKYILEMAVCVADILRFPENSILVVEGMPQKFRKFHALYNHINFATICPDKESKDDESWLCDISLKKLDPLWEWFETNDDILFRVSLLLARMNVESINQELIKLRPSSELQGLPSVCELNHGNMSTSIVRSPFQQEAQKLPEQHIFSPPKTTGKPYVLRTKPRRYKAELTQSIPERRTFVETGDQLANVHENQRTTKYKSMRTHHENEENAESSNGEVQEMRTAKRHGLAIGQSPHLEAPEARRDYAHESHKPRPRSYSNEASDRRHSEWSQPAHSYREPHLGYQYPHSARRQEPCDNDTDFPDVQSSGW